MKLEFWENNSTVFFMLLFELGPEYIFGWWRQGRVVIWVKLGVVTSCIFLLCFFFYLAKNSTGSLLNWACDKLMASQSLSGGLEVGANNYLRVCFRRDWLERLLMGITWGIEECCGRDSVHWCSEYFKTNLCLFAVRVWWSELVVSRREQIASGHKTW